MNRLQLEVQRLYAPQAPGGQDMDTDDASLIDARGRVRAMVLELAGPADWEALSNVWKGVQVDLELPAPAIAVNGKDGYQLWFSLSEPVPAPQALVFLESLRVHYLSDIRAQRIALWPTVEASSPPQTVHARRVPAAQENSGRWSAFVAPDLAPMFAEEPWLDLPPGPDGQSSLLSRLASIPIADLQRVQGQLDRSAMAVPDGVAPQPEGMADAGAVAINPRAASTDPWADPKRFLLDVMNNHAVALGLRIEAAKALLPYFDDARRQ